MVYLSQDSQHSKDLFGRQRLWGCVGQSAVGLVSAFTIERFGFTGMFVILLVSCVIFTTSILIFLSMKFKTVPVEATVQVIEPASLESKVHDANDVSANSSRSPFIRLVTHSKFMILLLLVLVGGVTRGIVGNYLQQYLERYYLVDPVDYASYTASRLLTEIGAFFIGKPLLEMFGAEALLMFGIIAGMLRVGSYGFMPMKPSWRIGIPFIELLKGLNAAFIVVGGTRIAHDIAPPGAEATAQGFFSGIHGNLSNAFSGLFGSLVISILKDGRLALRHMFQVSTLITLGSCLIYCVFLFF
jgi:hypothetical protein